MRDKSWPRNDCGGGAETLAFGVKACLEALRPANSAMLGFAVIVGAAIAAGGPPPLEASLYAFATGFFLGASAMVLNDIVDVEVDRVNAPGRPIPSGRLGLRAAWACFAALTLAGLVSAAATGLYTFAIALAAWGVASLYDAWGKRSGLPGNAMVAFNVAVPLIYGEALVGRFSPAVTVFWAMVFLTALAREVAKGIADVEGDRLAGVRTVAVSRGTRAAARLAALLYAAAAVLSPVPLLRGWVNPLAYGVPVAVVDALLALAAARLLASPVKPVALWHKRLVLLAMLLGLIGFYLGVTV